MACFICCFISEKSSCVWGRYVFGDLYVRNSLITAKFYCYFQTVKLVFVHVQTTVYYRLPQWLTLFSFHLTFSTLFIPNTATTQSRGTGYHRRCGGPTFVAAPKAPSEGRRGVPVWVCDGLDEFQRKWCHSCVSTVTLRPRSRYAREC